MSKAISPSSPSILPSPSPPLSSRGQRALTPLFAKHLFSINFEPLTKKGIIEFNPRLLCIFTNKKGVELDFEPSGAKEGGSALGTIYKTKRTEKKWLGKVGFPTGRLRYVDLSRPQFKDINISVILEKLAYDLYQEFGRGLFGVPKTLLSKQKVKDPFNDGHELAITWTELGIQETLRIMCKYVRGYKDFRHARTQDGSFIDYIKTHHRPPEKILTETGELVPLTGFVEMLAVGRVLADTDLLNKEGGNAGFVWIQDEQGKICAAQTVKIDPGEAFHFKDDDPEVINLVHRTHEKRGNDKYWLSDLRDVQTANNHIGSDGKNTGIEWKALTEAQREQFLSTLMNCLRHKNNPDVLSFLIVREGRFCREIKQEVYKPIAERILQEMSEWLDWQQKIYAKDLQAFAKKYPEKVLQIQYLDRYGELALPTSEETLPIRGLFTQLELIEVSKEPDGPPKKSSDPSKKMAPDSLTSEKRIILLEDLFSLLPGQSDEKTPRKVLVLGNPGTGKSTLCQKSAHDWASGRLWRDKFKAVFWIQSRQCNPAVGHGKDLANFESSENWLGKAVSHLILGQPDLCNSFQQFIHSHKGEILVVVDGIDEASPEVTRILDLLLSDPELALLLTSRREAAAALHQRVDRIVENSGFSEEQEWAYTERFFQRKELSLKGSHLAFHEALKQNPQFMQIAHIPLYLQMLCALWEQKETKVFPGTVTALYEEMVHLLFQWHYHKVGKNTSKEEEVMYSLGELAYHGLSAEGVASPVFQDGKIAKDDLLASGLLRESRTGEFEFVHLTFQEFLAARFIGQQPPEIQKRVVVEKRYHPHFQIFMRFLAGIINGKGSRENLEHSKEFFRWLYSSTPKTGADLLGFSQFELVVACLNECPQIPLHSWVHQNFNHQEIFLHIMQCETPLMQESRQGWFDQFTDSIASTFTEVENTNFIRKEPCKLGRLFERYPLGLNIFWENLCRLLETKDNPCIIPGVLATVARYGKNIPASFIHRMAVALVPLINTGILGVLSRIANIITTKEQETDYGAPLRALGEIGMVATGEAQLIIVNTLVEALEGSNLQMRYAAATAFEHMAKTFPERQIPKIVTPLLQRITTRDEMHVASTAESALLKILEVSSQKTISFILPVLFKLLKKEEKEEYHYPAIVEILGAAAKVATEEEVSVIVHHLVESLPDHININNYFFFEFVFLALAQASKRVPADQVSVLVETVLGFLEKSQNRPSDKFFINHVRADAIKVIAQIAKKIPVDQILRVTLVFLKELQIGPRDIFTTPAILKATKKLVQSNTLQQMPDIIENLSKILDLLLPFVKRISRKGSDEERQEIAKALNQLKEALSIQDPANGISGLLEKAIGLQGYLATDPLEAQRTSKKESKEFSPSTTDDIDELLMEWKNPDSLISRSAIMKLGEMVAILPTPDSTSRVIEALVVARKHGDPFMRDYVKKVLNLIPFRKYLECFATINWSQICPVFLEQILKREALIFLQETSSGLTLCLHENNQIVSQTLSPHQVQFLKNWSQTEAPLCKYTAGYLNERR